MAVIERHISPDGALELRVDLVGGDWTIGFVGYRWHMHSDILIGYGRTAVPGPAVRVFVDEIIGSRRVIAVHRRDGVMFDVTVPDDFVDRPLKKTFGKYAPPGETFELRYWDGGEAGGS